MHSSLTMGKVGGEHLRRKEVRPAASQRGLLRVSGLVGLRIVQGGGGGGFGGSAGASGHGVCVTMGLGGC